MKKHLFDNPQNTKRVVQALVVCCVVLFFLDAVIHRHTSHAWEEVFGFYPIYGFVSCVVLVLIAREIRKLVMRDEQYYEASGENSDRKKDSENAAHQPTSSNPEPVSDLRRQEGDDV